MASTHSPPPPSKMEGPTTHTQESPVVSGRTRKAPPVVRLTAILLFPLVMVGLVAWWLPRSGNIAAGPPPPVGPAVPDFTLTRQDGTEIGLSDLRGSVCIVDFIFTRCAGPCPELTARMRSLALAMEQWPEPARLVSITLDPKFDRPEVLRRYAQRFHVDTARWWFLTGDDEEMVHRLVREGFLQTVIPATDEGPLIHSNHLIILDRQGRIRASHDGMDPDAKPRILTDAKSLLAHIADDVRPGQAEQPSP